MQGGGGGEVQRKKLNASNTHIKAVNTFYYRPTGKDGSVKWPYIAVCRKAVITKIQVTQGIINCLMCSIEMEMDKHSSKHSKIWHTIDLTSLS